MAGQARKIAVIGDIHGCIDELVQLYRKLEWLSLDEIWGAGDLVDRGPDSGAVVRFFRERKIPTVKGNHEDSIVNAFGAAQRTGTPPGNPDKARTVSQLKQEDVDWIKALPLLHVFDDTKLIVVHGGMWPRLPIHAQPINVMRAQLIKPWEHGESRWWGSDAVNQKGKAKGKTEADSIAEGWERWYKLYDHEHDCVFGHSVFAQPLLHKNPGAGRCVGVDTGSCFGGSVTAAVFDGSREPPFFVSVKAAKVYYEITRRLIPQE